MCFSKLSLSRVVPLCVRFHQTYYESGCEGLGCNIAGNLDCRQCVFDTAAYTVVSPSWLDHVRCLIWFVNPSSQVLAHCFLSQKTLAVGGSSQGNSSRGASTVVAGAGQAHTFAGIAACDRHFCAHTVSTPRFHPASPYASYPLHAAIFFHVRQFQTDLYPHMSSRRRERIRWSTAPAACL